MFKGGLVAHEITTTTTERLQARGEAIVETHPIRVPAHLLRHPSTSFWSHTPVFSSSFDYNPSFAVVHTPPRICPLLRTFPSLPHITTLHTRERAHVPLSTTMSDDKKSYDYRVDMPSGKEFRAASPMPRSASSSRAGPAITENPIAAVLAYCGSSIMMTVTNKYVLSGVDFNLPFFLLCVQVRA